MSYEGYQQCICERGHYYTVNSGNFLAGFATDEEYQKCFACPHCSAPPVWENPVDETNCDAVGTIQIERFMIARARYETCNLGHTHLVEQPRYRVPTKEETKAARSYYDSRHSQYVKLSSLK